MYPPHVFCWASCLPLNLRILCPPPLIFLWTSISLGVFYQNTSLDGNDGSSSSSSSDAVTSSPSRPAASSLRNVFQTVVERLSGPSPGRRRWPSHSPCPGAPQAVDCSPTCPSPVTQRQRMPELNTPAMSSPPRAGATQGMGSLETGRSALLLSLP